MNDKTNKTLLVVAAHPDDEVLGCGATVRLLVNKGWHAHLLIMTGGEGGRHQDPEKDISSAQDALRKQSELAADLLGFLSITRFDFPDNRMDTISRMDLSHAIRKVVDEVHPGLVMTHHPGDYNWDHGMVFDSVMMACRRNPGDFSPTEIRAFEVPSSTERGMRHPDKIFCPTLYQDVSETIEVKKRALQAYSSEYRDYPHPRSVEALEYLARLRGNEVGLDYAEAFQLIRKVNEQG